VIPSVQLMAGLDRPARVIAIRDRDQGTGG